MPARGALGPSRGRARRRAWAACVVVLLVAAGVGSSVAGVWTTASPPRPMANEAFGAGPSGAVTVWAVGDGDGGEDSARLVDRIAADRPARLLYLGDVYDRGTADDFARNYAPTFGRLARLTAPTPGNHDWPRHDQGYDVYWRGITGKPTPPWYAFRMAGWEILSLNSQASLEPGGSQLRWLATQLSEPGTCRLAFWHRPYLNAGRHGDAGDVAPLWRALRGKAALVVNGHDHGSQRFRPVDGITQVVAGAGGRSHYGVDEGDPRLAFADDRADAALRLRLHAGRAELATVASDGRVLDRATTTCRPLASPAA